MKKTMRKTTLGITAALACVCLGVGVGLSARVEANADTAATTTTASLAAQNGFMIESGAAVRISERSGIRFTAYLDQEGYNSVVSNGVMRANKALGILVVPSSYVDDYEAAVADGSCTTGYYEYFRDVKGKRKDFRFTDASQIMTDAKYGYKIRAAVVDIMEGNRDLNFVAIGYIETTDGETKTYQYTEVSDPRCVRYVATKAMENQDVSSSQMETLSDLYGITYKTIDVNNAPYDTQVFVDTAYADKTWGEMETLTLEGNTFLGWFTEDGEEWNGDMSVGALYAKWAAVTTPGVSSTGSVFYKWDDTVSKDIYTAAKKTFSGAFTGNDSKNTTMSSMNAGKFATGNTSATTHTLSLPQINYNNYAKTTFTIGNTWTTYKVSVGETEIVAWSDLGVACNITIQNGKLYADDVLKSTLSDEILSGSAALTFTITETGSGDTGAFMVSDFTGYGYDETGLTVIENSSTTTTKVAWTDDDISASEAAMEAENWSSNVSGYSVCSAAPTTNWTNNWWDGYEVGALKISSGGGFILVPMPKMSYAGKTVTFNLYCNWGTKDLYFVNAATTYDTAIFGTFGHSNDAYTQYMKVTIADGVVSARLVNDGVEQTASTTTYTLTSDEKTGESAPTIKFKGGNGNNIVISALKVEETVVTKTYYVNNRDRLDTFVGELESKDFTSLTDTEKYDLLEEYNGYVAGLNKYEADDLVEADIIQTLRQSISGALRVHGGSNEALFVNKVYYLDDGGAEQTQSRSGDSDISGITAGGKYNIQKSTDYVVLFNAVNYKQFCDKYGVVYFGVATNYDGLTFTVNDASFTSVKNTVTTLAVKDGKLFADGKLFTVLSDDVYTGKTGLTLKIERPTTATYSAVHISSLYTAAEWKTTSSTTFTTSQITLVGANGETAWNIFENNSTKFENGGVAANIQKYKDGTAAYDFKVTLPVVKYTNYAYTTYTFKISGTGGSVAVGAAKFAVAGETATTITVRRNGTVYVDGVLATGFAASASVVNGTEGLQIGVSRASDNQFGAVHFSTTIEHENTTDDAFAFVCAEDDAFGVKNVSGTSYLPVVTKKDFADTDALYFYNGAASSATFSVAAVQQAVIGVSFAYKLNGVANGAKINDFAVGDMIADGAWHVCTLEQRIAEFTGMSLTVESFVGELLIADIEYTPWASYTVSFENCDVEPIKVYQGEKIVVDNPTKNGYTFVKWVDADGNDFDMDQSVREDVTLTAYWTKNVEGVAWTQAMLDETVTFSENKFSGNLTQTECKIVTGDKATANWEFDWRGAMKIAPVSGGYCYIQLPKIDYTQKNIAFNMYCNWGYRILRAGYSANYDAVTFCQNDAFGNVQDSYHNYLILSVTNGVMSVKAWNDGVISDFATTWTLPDAVANGNEPLLLKFRDGSGTNIILSDIRAADRDYIAEYKALTEALTSVSVSALSEADKQAYIARYDAAANCMSDYESQKYGMPTKIAEMKSSLGTLTVLEAADSSVSVTCVQNDAKVTIGASGQTGGGRLDYDVNTQVQNSDGTDVCEYVVTLGAVDYKSAVRTYGVAYFTVNSNYSYTIDVGGTQVLNSAANTQHIFLIHNGRLYVDGVYKTELATSVYSGLKGLTFTFGTLGKTNSPYQFFAMTNVYADYATYESYKANFKTGTGGVSDIPTTVQDTISVVENGVAKYNVLYDKDLEGGTGAKAKLGYAVNDLCAFLKETTGAAFSANDTDLAAENIAETANYILVGELAAQVNDNDYSGLTTETGYKIVRKGNLVCIYGRTVQGALNGVYGFLNAYTGLRFYTDEVYDYNATENISISQLDITFNPSIDYNMASGGTLTGCYEANASDYPWNYQHRLGFVTEHYVTGTSMHNFLGIISEESYKAEHPNWFTTETVYTSDNVATSETFTTLNLAYNNFEMAETIAASLANTIENDTYKRTFYCFSQPDKRGWSTTTASAAIKSQYGTYSAEYILMMNKVAQILDEQYTFDRPISLTLLAYGMALEAPDFNEDLRLYSSNDVKVGVYFAPIDMSLYRSFDATEESLWDVANTYYKAEFNKWAALTGELYFWNYSENIDNYFIPLDTISNMQSKYQLAASLGVKVLKDQGQMGNKTSLDWEALKVFLKSELAKNVNADVAALTKEFCDAYYGAASEYMQQLLKLQQEWSETLATRSKGVNATHGETLGMVHSGTYLLNTNCWDEGAKTWALGSVKYDNSMLKTWYGYITNALAAVEGDDELQNRVRLEGLSIRYLAVRVYDSAVVSGDTVAKIIEDAKALGVKYYAEGKSIDNLGNE